MSENTRTNRSTANPELFQILQLIPLPAVLMDAKKEIILNCNSSFTKVTGYTSSEILNRPVTQLFSNPKIYAQIKSVPLAVELVYKDLGSYLTNVKFQYLDPQQQLAVLIFENLPGESFSKKTHPGFYNLINMIASENLTTGSLFSEKVNLFVESLLIDSAAFYLFDPQKKSLRKKSSFPREALLPDELPGTDLDRLTSPVVWIPGKRVLTEIHRFAKIHNFASMATIGVEQKGEIEGIFVFSTLNQIAPCFELESMRLFQLFLHERLGKENMETSLNGLLKKKEAEFTISHQVFTNSPEGIVIIDSNYAVVQINPSAEWMLGYANWEVAGESIDNLLIGPNNFSAALDQAKLGITTHNLGDSVIHHRDGHSFPAQLQVIPVGEKEEPQHILIVFRDISEHEQIIARTQQLEHRALLGDVTSVFAHEVRNPINNISTGLQLIASRMGSSDPNHDVISRIQNDCVRLNDLMESVLAFSKPIEQKFEDIELPAMMQRLLDRWHPRMSKHAISFNLEVEKGVPVIKGNLRSLERVFINLISNAIEAMEKNGGLLAIKISNAMDPGNHAVVRISVADNGAGMPEEIRKKLFEPFVTNKQHGTGLGLAITKKIVTAHKGTISVDSFAGGTIFNVTIPVGNGANG